MIWILCVKIIKQRIANRAELQRAKDLGKELFGNDPREITFANQGGIMSTNKAFQRVA